MGTLPPGLKAYMASKKAGKPMAKKSSKKKK